MKTIVYIISTLKRTGPVNILFDVIKYLDRQAFQPIIITLSPEEGNSRYDEFAALDVKIDTISIRRNASFWKDLAGLKAKVHEHNPTVIHTIGFRADFLAAVCLKKYRKISSQLNYPFDDYVMTYGKLKGRIMARLTVWSLRKFRYSITCAEDVANKLRTTGLKMEVIYNSIDTSLFKPPTEDEKSSLRKTLGIPAHSKHVFIFVGVLSDRKQPLVALEAFLSYKEKYEDAYLIVLGNGPLQAECIKISSLAPDNIMFAGNVPDTRPWLKASDFYIATSKAEGMPVSVLEALALKLPVVLSEIPPHKEILQFNTKAGKLAAISDVADTVMAMIAISSMEIAEAGNAACSITNEHLNAQKMSSAYQSYYYKACNHL